jgi:hypothetical protein
MKRPRPGGRAEQRRLAGQLRAEGLTWVDIARELRGRYSVNPRAALRLAHRWSQNDAARHWNTRFPDDPKTFKSFSYWEQWPGASGHAPAVEVLHRLAALYECGIGHLLEDWSSHERDDDNYGRPPGGLDVLVGDGMVREPRGPHDPAAEDSGQEPAAVQGIWHSHYSYRSTSRRQAFRGEHYVVLDQAGGRVSGRSLPHRAGSRLALELMVDGQIVTGTWRERTSPGGHYRGATYHGAIQLVVDPRGRRMKGRWLGYDAEFRIAVGDWHLTWVDASISESAQQTYAYRL